MDRSLSNRGSVDGSQTHVVLSIPSPPDGMEERRWSSPVKDCCNFLLEIVVFPILEICLFWYLFVMNAIASPFLCILGCLTLNIKLLAQSASVIPHLVLCLIMTISLPITPCTKKLSQLIQNMKLQWLPSMLEGKLFVISCIAVSLDPFFFYIPILDEKNKCLDMDNKLMIALLVLRSLSDLFFISRIVTRFHTPLNNDQLVELERDNWWPLCTQLERRLKLQDFLLDSLAILPVQQVAIIIAFFRMESSRYSYKMAAVNIFLVLHLIFRIYHMYSSYRSIIGSWTKSALNFCFYILAAHVLGAFWYLFSIQRETSCWHQVCQNTTGCITTYHCKDTAISPSVTILDNFCPVSVDNATVFDFGIFLDALQSGTTTGSKNFPTKFLYTFWWGLRNLSNFGTNLQTSTYVWETFFTILIGVIGILLFLLLIGNVQTYILKWASEKEIAEMDEKIFTTRNAINSWISRHLSSDENLKREITEHIREVKIVEKHYDSSMDVIPVNLKFFFSILDNEKATYLKEHFCKPALKKVLERRYIDKYLSVIIQHLEPKIYQENESVVQIREPLHTMLFVIDGEIVSGNEGSNAGVGDEGSNAGVESCICKSKYIQGDLFAEDILSLQSKLAPPPLSTRDYKCKTKVETFALTYEKWRSILSDIQRQQNEELVVYSKTKPILLNKAYKKLTTRSCWTIQREMRLNLKNVAYSASEDQELREMIHEKERGIHDWLSRNGVSENTKTKIMTNIRVNGIMELTIDDDVDVKYLLSHGRLPWDIQKSIRKELGMRYLTKVPMLQKMDKSVLLIMCETYLQPEIYEAQTCLVQAEKEVALMFIVIEGKVVVISKAGSRRCLEKGHFYGESLLSWASPNNLLSSPPPISKEHVICLTKVEALALNASQFRTLVADFSSQWMKKPDDDDLPIPSGFNSQLIAEPDDDMAFPYDEIDQKLNEAYMQLESNEVGLIEEEELRQKIKIMLKEKEILKWVSSLGPSEYMMTQIKRSIKISKVVEENADVNLEYVLSILPPNIKQSLKEHICISSLRKVPILENVNEDLLNRICLNLEPMILPEHYYFINAGQELDKMIIVVNGVVSCTSILENGTPLITRLFKKGSVYGEELLTLAFPEIYFPPVSDQDVICRKKVEALVLTVDGLRRVLSYYKDRLSHSDNQPLDWLEGVVAADTSVSSSTTLEQRLDQIHQLQLSQWRMLVEMAAKLGLEPPILQQSEGFS